ncbi:MAG: glycerate kinase [Verrucomicrobiia bacterium]
MSSVYNNRLRILIVPDKFKGTLTALSAAEAIKKGWKKARRQDFCEVLPMSDGGDGFGEVVSRLLNCRTVIINSVDASHTPRRVKYWWNQRQKIAVVESARVIGLAMLPAEKQNPLELDTFGLGIVLKKIFLKKPTKIFIGIGGSATNDGGFGMARALGWKFCDRYGNEIHHWTGLSKLESIKPPAKNLITGEVIVAVDVQNKILGKKGCSRIYGPQKGLKKEEIPLAESFLKRLVKIAEKDLNKNFNETPGSGAAGGLGYGLMTFVGAKPVSGFKLFSQLSGLENRIKNCDIIITGEGSIDASTAMGKGVGEIAKLCKKHGKICIGLAGRVSNPDEIKKCFNKTLSLLELTEFENAQKNAVYWLEILAENAAKNLNYE